MKILVVGAGIAGMGAALALAAPDREIIVLERDPPPPNLGMDEVFDTWERKGVTQLRHAHGYPARFFNIIRDRHPALLKALLEAEAREVTFGNNLSPALQKRYRPQPGDADLSVLLSRRTTLEFVMRAYVESRPGISFATDTKVRGLVVEKGRDGIHTLKALRIEKPDSTQEEMRADLIVDASGRNSNFRDWLTELGIVPEVEEEPVGVVYYTRHYRLRPGKKLTYSTDTARVELDFLLGGVLLEDGNNLAVMFQVPLGETILRQRILHPEVFDRICAALPAIAEWTGRSDPVNNPLGMGNLKNMWVHWLKNGKPLVKNFFAIGDAAIRTNPAFGRGCTFAFVQADILAEILRETDDPLARIKSFEKKVEAAIRPFYMQIVRQDRMIIERAGNAHDPGYRPNFRARLMKSFAENAVIPAVRGNISMRRAFSRGRHMLEDPNIWLRKKPGLLLRLLIIWAMPRWTKAYLPPTALDYATLMALVNAT